MACISWASRNVLYSQLFTSTGKLCHRKRTHSPFKVANWSIPAHFFRRSFAMGASRAKYSLSSSVSLRSCSRDCALHSAAPNRNKQRNSVFDCSAWDLGPCAHNDFMCGFSLDWHALRAPLLTEFLRQVPTLFLSGREPLSLAVREQECMFSVPSLQTQGAAVYIRMYTQVEQARADTFRNPVT